MIGPQPGPQTTFLCSSADIVVFGGSAGGGKTYAMLLEALRHIGVPGFGAVIFRRTLKQVKDEGGLWDKSAEIYSLIGAHPNLSERTWTFQPTGTAIQFAGMEHEANKFDWQGAEICFIGFEELTHFTEGQFFYLLSRNRSTCGVRPYIRATTNPGPGWVKRLLAPWIDRKFPNPARSGEIRWFIREHGRIVWVDEPPNREPCTKGEDGGKCLREGCENCFPPEKSITFVRSSVYDNKKLLEADPGYIANLMALPDLERRQLLDGDWDARPPNLLIDAFDDGVHVVPYTQKPMTWLRYLGADFGSINHAQVVLAEDPENKHLYVIGEHWPGVSMTPEAIAREVRKMAGCTPHKGAGGSRQEDDSRYTLKFQGLPVDPPEIKDVGLQYECVNNEFRGNRLFVSDNCPVLISMLQSLQRKIGTDGLPTDEFDDTTFHLLAALRYIVAKLRPVAKKTRLGLMPGRMIAGSKRNQ